jgi:hypothetical protein
MGYTEFNTAGLTDFDDDDYDIYCAADYMKNPNNFRDFDEGLKELMYKKGYDINLNYPKLSDILYQNLKSIGSTIKPATVTSWFNKEHRPKVEAGYRQQIYEICFALKLSYNDTKWFFHHVYYDRAFNCHTIDESVYYYAFINGLSYQESQEIISTINNSQNNSVDKNSLKEFDNYTQFVRERIDSFKSKDELIDFLTYNKDNFSSWNHTAYDEIKNRVNELLPSDEGKKEIDNIKRTIKRNNNIDSVPKNLSSKKEWGLLMQEFFSNISSVDDLQYISGLPVKAQKFIIRRILSFNSTATKIDTISIPYIVKNNFPSIKTLSDILDFEKIRNSKSYDAIRKLIILLNFYVFWVRIDLGYVEDIKEFSNEELYDTFVEELNYTLYRCGYEPLYPGNPYDWLFMFVSLKQKPLKYFRYFIEEISLDDEE